MWKFWTFLQYNKLLLCHYPKIFKRTEFRQAKKTEVLLDKLTYHTLNIETQQYVSNTIIISIYLRTGLFLLISYYLQIMQFLYQLLQRPLKISGLGLCFGYKYLLQVCNYSFRTNIIVVLLLNITANYS